MIKFQFIISRLRCMSLTALLAIKACSPWRVAARSLAARLESPQGGAQKQVDDAARQQPWFIEQLKKQNA